MKLYYSCSRAFIWLWIGTCCCRNLNKMDNLLWNPFIFHWGTLIIKRSWCSLTNGFGRPMLCLKFFFFAWKAGREYILTTDNLMRRGRVMVNVCYSCKRATETCNHLLLWCPMVYNLWFTIYGIRCKKKKKSIKIILLTIFWLVWKKKIRWLLKGWREIFLN